VYAYHVRLFAWLCLRERESEGEREGEGECERRERRAFL
jgi:hypothetical protein